MVSRLFFLCLLLFPTLGMCHDDAEEGLEGKKSPSLPAPAKDMHYCQRLCTNDAAGGFCLLKSDESDAQKTTFSITWRPLEGHSWKNKRIHTQFDEWQGDVWSVSKEDPSACHGVHITLNPGLFFEDPQAGQNPELLSFLKQYGDVTQNDGGELEFVYKTSHAAHSMLVLHNWMNDVLPTLLKLTIDRYPPPEKGNSTNDSYADYVFNQAAYKLRNLSTTFDGGYLAVS